MLLCFVDESDQGNFHGFGGLMADEHATKAITGPLNRIMRQFAVDWASTGIRSLTANRNGKHVPVRMGAFHKGFEAILAEDVGRLARPLQLGTGGQKLSSLIGWWCRP